MVERDHPVKCAGWNRSCTTLRRADEIRIMLDPVTVGGGKRLFRDDGVRRSLKLVDSEVTSKGAILTTYAVAAETTPASRETMREVIASR